MSDRRADAVAVVVLRGAGDAAEVLLLRRGRGVFAGAWTFVMGGVEARERATDTARREVLEETGLAVRALYTAGALDTFYDPLKDRVVSVPFFVARVENGDVTIDAAHDAFRWTTFAEAATSLTFAAQRRVLPDIHDAFVDAEPDDWRVIA